MRRVLDIIVLVVGLLPRSKTKNSLLRTLGWQIGKNVEIHSCLFWRLPSPVLGNRSVIQSFSVFRNTKLQIKDGGSIGHWNWVTSLIVPGSSLTTQRLLLLGENSAITSRHYIDCSGGLLIGDFSTIAGVRSVFFTHQISYKENIQTLLPIQIGNFVLVSSGVTTAPGSKIPDNCLVGMGSVLVSKPYLPSTFIAGEAAKSKQSVDGLYFKRTKGRVDFPHHDS